MWDGWVGEMSLVLTEQLRKHVEWPVGAACLPCISPDSQPAQRAWLGVNSSLPSAALTALHSPGLLAFSVAYPGVSAQNGGGGSPGRSVSTGAKLRLTAAKQHLHGQGQVRLPPASHSCAHACRPACKPHPATTSASRPPVSGG